MFFSSWLQIPQLPKYLFSKSTNRGCPKIIKSFSPLFSDFPTTSLPFLYHNVIKNNKFGINKKKLIGLKLTKIDNENPLDYSKDKFN